MPQAQREELDAWSCLTRIPFDPVTVLHAGEGYPIVVSSIGSPVAVAFSRLAEQVRAQLAAPSADT